MKALPATHHQTLIRRENISARGIMMRCATRRPKPRAVASAFQANPVSSFTFEGMQSHWHHAVTNRDLAKFVHLVSKPLDFTASKGCQIGSFCHMRTLLEAADVSPVRAQSITENFFAVIADERSKRHPVLGPIINLVKSDLRKAERLALVVLNRGTQLIAGEALFFGHFQTESVPFIPDPQVNPFANLLAPSQFENPQRMPRTVIFDTNDLNNNNSAVLWHELVHYRDGFFLDAWAAANRRLIDLGQEPDALFQENARIVHNKVEVDDGWLSVFMESRAWEVYAALSEVHFLKPAEQRMGWAQTCLSYLQSYGSTTDRSIMNYHVVVPNILQIGQFWSEVMQNTIDRASQLSATMGLDIVEQPT